MDKVIAIQKERKKRSSPPSHNLEDSFWGEELQHMGIVHVHLYSHFNSNQDTVNRTLVLTGKPVVSEMYPYQYSKQTIYVEIKTNYDIHKGVNSQIRVCYYSGSKTKKIPISKEVEMILSNQIQKWILMIQQGEIDGCINSD